MATLMYTLISMSLQCSVRREISPCTCMPHETLQNTISVTCDGVGSFNQVFDALQNKFQSNANIFLKITHSQLEDLETRSFQDLGFNIKHLQMNHDQLRILPESPFRNLSSIQYLSFADNDLEEIPIHILNHMPNISTLDFAYGKISKLKTNDLDALYDVRHLVMVNNALKILEKDSVPHSIVYLQLGRNNLTTLNDTLKQLYDMVVLFINDNQLTTLDSELPSGSQKLKSIIAHHNHLVNLPKELETFSKLDTIYFNNNELKSLDGTIKHGKNLLHVFLASNQIEYLAEDEFEYCAFVEILDIGDNKLKTLNRSLLPLKSIRRANFSHNLLNEFSLHEIWGLKYLRMLDLSYNRIEKLYGIDVSDANIPLESGSYLYELNLQHNQLKTLSGITVGLNKLHELNVAYNQFEYLSVEDLMGLEELEILDISHNNLKTIEDASKAFLPNLEKLDASFNGLTSLDKAFHGFPALCLADLSNNNIFTISPELVAKTRCINHGVLNKLEILLQENPILCEEGLPGLFTQMEKQDARLLGIAHCIVHKEDLPNHPELFDKPIISTIMPNQLPLIPNSILQQQSAPSILQLIVPGPLMLQPISVNTEQQPPQSLEHQPLISSVLSTSALIMSQQQQQQQQQLQPQQIESESTISVNQNRMVVDKTEPILLPTTMPAVVDESTSSSHLPIQFINTSSTSDNAIQMNSGSTTTSFPIIVPLEEQQPPSLLFNEASLTSSSINVEDDITEIEIKTLAIPILNSNNNNNNNNNNNGDPAIQFSSSHPVIQNQIQSTTTTVQLSPNSESSQDEQQQPQPQLQQMELMDNSVHETFSPLPPHVINTNLDRTKKNLLELDEPPEIPQFQNENENFPSSISKK